MRAAYGFVFLLGVSSLVSGCTTTGPNTASGLVNRPPLMRSVDPDMAQACIGSAANRYFLPTRVIQAVDSQKVGTSTQVILKVDLRDAVCTINASGQVVSVVDTSPKSADQLAAEARAAQAKTATAAAKP